MPKKKTKDLRKLVERVLNRDDDFYKHLERALSDINDVREKRIGLEKTCAPEAEIHAAKQKEARLVNGLLQRIQGLANTRFEALEDAFGDLKRAVLSNRWEYPF